MATVYSGYSKGWKPSGSDIYKKYRARVDYSVSAETPTTITYRAVLYVNINSTVNASYSGTLNISGTSYTGSCKTVLGEGNTVTCVSAKTKTFNKGATATTATIKGSVKSSNGSWTGASVVATATVTIPALVPATITFDANDGSGTVPTAINTYVGVANTIPSNSLTRPGYTFNGWNTASDGSGTAYATGSTIAPTGDVTLYAQWQTTYVKPEIQNLLAFRVADASGGASPTVTSTGETGFCKFELVGGANYTFTSATVQFGTAPAKSMTQSGNIVYGYSTPDSISQTSAYTVKITVVVTGIDGVLRTYTDSTYISKSVPVFDVASNGNCFAFFGTAIDGLTDPKLIINGEMAFGTEADAAVARTNLGVTATNLGINDYVVEQGTYIGWKYRKWNSGIAECFGYISLGSISVSAVGNVYRGTATVLLPGLFNDIPSNVHITNGNPLASVISINGRATDADHVSVYIWKSTSGAADSVSASFHVIGTWK